MKSILTRRSASTTMTLLAFTAAVALAASSAPLFAQGAWKNLFDGKDFTGWTSPAGGGRGTPSATPPSTNPAERSWKIDNGAISSVPTAESKQPSGGLNTVDKFYDFELELDYKL